MTPVNVTHKIKVEKAEKFICFCWFSYI